MLTRAQVAKRLGKSIATVRRLEGERLHPRRDAAGVYRFDAAEVDQLVSRARLPRHWNNGDLRVVGHETNRWSGTESPLSSAASPPADSVEAKSSSLLTPRERAVLQASELNNVTARLGALEERWSALEGARAQHESELQHASIAEELCELVASLSARQLRRTDPHLLDEVAYWLDCLEVQVARR